MSEPVSPRRLASAWTSKIWRPILAGATLHERLAACLGAILVIAVTGLACAVFTGGDARFPLLVAPMGASAVLLFAVPSSPLAQPWPTIGGNIVSAAVGLIVAAYVPNQVVAAGIAVGLAIAAMSFLRCLHPPGGAAALIAAFGGPTVTSMGVLFPLVPVGLNAAFLVALGWAYHNLRGRSYPHKAQPIAVNTHNTKDEPAVRRTGVRPEDIDSALEVLGETFDISREDIGLLIHEVEKRALVRSNAELTCADIMSRDVIAIDHMADPGAARAYLLAHDLRTLPVIDSDRRVLGYVGFPHLQKPASRVAGMMEKAVTALPDTPAMELIDKVSNGKSHAVIIVDSDNRLQGIVTQTDLLAALSTGLLNQRKAA